MTRISNLQLQPRQLFCLHRKSCCQSQLLASVLLFAPLELTLLFEAGESDFLFGLQALDPFGVLLLLCELDWKGGCLVGSLSIPPSQSSGEGPFFVLLFTSLLIPSCHPPQHQPGTQTQQNSA